MRSDLNFRQYISLYSKKVFSPWLQLFARNKPQFQEAILKLEKYEYDIGILTIGNPDMFCIYCKNGDVFKSNLTDGDVIRLADRIERLESFL